MPETLEVRVLRDFSVSSDPVGKECVAALAAEQANVAGLNTPANTLTNEITMDDHCEKQAGFDECASTTETSATDEPFNKHDSQSPRKIKGWLWALCVLAMLSSIFLVALDITVTATIQPAVVRQFQSTDKLAWVSVAFLCASASTSLTWGQVYTRFDVKLVYLLCIAIFEIGSTICGAAPTMDSLIVGRAICGVGGAGMYTGVTILLTINTNEKERAQYFGLCGLTWGFGTVLGPLIAGAFADSSATWRWAFYINLCVGAVFTIVVLGLVPRAPASSDQGSFLHRLKSIDWIGFVLLAGVFVSGLMMISFGGALYGWGSRSMIILYWISGVLTITFLAHQWFLTTRSSTTATTATSSSAAGVLPLSMFKSMLNATMFLASCCASTALYTSTYFIPLYFQFVKGNSAIEAGVRLLPFIVFSSVSGIFSGFVLGRLPYHMPWLIFGPALLVIGGSLFFTVGTRTPLANVYGYSILLGFGAGCWIQLPFTIVSCKNDPEQARLVTGVLAFAQVAAPAVSLAIANSIFLNVATSKLRLLGLPGDPSRAGIQGMISSVSRESLTSGDAETTSRVIAGILSALHYPFILMITAGGITLLLCLFLRWERTFPKQT